MEKKKLQISIKKINFLFLSVFVFYAVYYGWRFAGVAPWYDELFTYKHFIDAGPVYAATHWPLPNNHVLFSVLSGVLNLFTNNIIGLRGISYLAALFCLWGIYRLLLKCVGSILAVAGVLLYASMYLINNLSVQGRGYTLANACLIVALLTLYEICVKEAKKRFYVLFSLSLIAGLYTLVSSIYWVIPVCIAGGLFLLLHKKWKKVLALIFSSICAAVGTLFLYGILWVSIGIDLIRNDVNSGYFQADSFRVLKAFPLYAIKRGMLFMLSDGNVQSIERSAFLHDFHYFARDVIGSFFLNQGYLFIGMVIISIIIILLYFIVGRICNKRIDLKLQFLLMFGTIPIILLPVILFIQSVYPFARVFSFMGIEMTLLFIGVIYLISSLFLIKKATYKNIVSYFLFGTLCIYSLAKCFNSYYNAPYYKQDQYVREVIRAIELNDNNMEKTKSVLSTDICCDYQIYFYLISERGYGMNLVENKDNPDILILNKSIRNTSDDWTLHTTMEDIPQDWMDNHMKLIFENEMYQLYEKGSSKDKS